MITPEYLSRMLTLLEVHKELSESILRDIVRRVIKTNFQVTDTASYQAEILQGAGGCFDEILEHISKEAGRQSAEGAGIPDRWETRWADDTEAPGAGRRTGLR